VADHHQGNSVAGAVSRILPALAAGTVGSGLTSLGVSLLGFGRLPFLGPHLVLGVVSAGVAAWAAGSVQRERRFWLALWTLLPAVALANLYLELVPIQAYGDYRWLQREEAFSSSPARWLGGYALLRQAAGLLDDPAAGFAALLRVAGILVTAAAALFLHAGRPGRLAVVLPTLTPIWLLFAAGHMEYYPLIAWAVPVILLWALDRPLAERSPIHVGAVAAALFPLLYVGLAPLALCLLGAYALAVPPRRSAVALLVAAGVALLGIGIFYPAGIGAFVEGLPKQIPRGEVGLFHGYRGLAASPTSIVFAWEFVFSRVHLQDLTFLQLVGGGWLAPILLVGAAAWFGVRRGGLPAGKRTDRRIGFALAVLAAYGYFFLRMLPRLGPRDDLDLFFSVYLIVATLAGVLVDRRLEIGGRASARRRLLLTALALGASASGGALLLVGGVRMPEPWRELNGRQLVAAHLEENDAKSLERLEEAVAREAVSIEWLAVDGAARGVGLEHDRWTLGEEPAAVRLHNLHPERRGPRLRLAVGHGPRGLDRPIRVIVRDGERTQELVFARPGVRWLDLETLAVDEVRWIFLSATPSWQAPAPDGRWLGVNVRQIDLVPTAG
jgi:hypothetical protein